MAEKNQTSASVPPCPLAVDAIIYASMDGSIESAFLPEDIIVDEILPRLPIKHLFKFTCVSKRYKSIICVPKFGQSYLQQAYSSHETLSSSGLLSLWSLLFPYMDLIFINTNENIKVLTDTINDSCDQESIRLSCIPPPNDHESHYITGSSNGLILSVVRQSEYCFNLGIYVSNPLTKQCVKLPDPPTIPTFSGILTVTVVCIATKVEQDASAFLTYKVVTIQSDYVNTILQIFSSDSGSWAARKLSIPQHVVRCFGYSAAFAYKGILYWMNRENGTVATYDPFDSPDGFGCIQLPETDYDDSCLIYSGDHECLKYCGVVYDYSSIFNSNTVWVWQLVDEWCLECKFVVQSTHVFTDGMRHMVAPNPFNRRLICHPFHPVYCLGEKSWEYMKMFPSETGVEKPYMEWSRRRSEPFILIELCPWSSPFYPQS